MKVAKLIRHRHIYKHEMNGTLTDIEIQNHFKVIFPDRVEKAFFEEWLKGQSGKYEWDAEKNIVNPDSILPEIEGLEGQDKCWCSVITHYLTQVAAFEFHSFVAPSVEIYQKST